MARHRSGRRALLAFEPYEPGSVFLSNRTAPARWAENLDKRGFAQLNDGDWTFHELDGHVLAMSLRFREPPRDVLGR